MGLYPQLGSHHAPRLNSLEALLLLPLSPTLVRATRFFPSLIAQDYVRYGYNLFLLRTLRREVGVPG